MATKAESFTGAPVDPSQISATGARRITAGEDDPLAVSGWERSISTILTEAPYNFGADDVAEIHAKGGPEALQAVRQCSADLVTDGLDEGDIARIAAKEGGAEALNETHDVFSPLATRGFPLQEIVRLAAFGNGADMLRNALFLSSHLSDLGIPDDTIVTAIHYSVVSWNGDATAMNEMLAAMEDPSKERTLRDLVALLERYPEVTLGSRRPMNMTELIELAKSGKGGKELARWDKFYETLARREKRNKAEHGSRGDPHAWKNEQAPRPSKPTSESLSKGIQELSAELTQAPYGFEESDVMRIAKAGGEEALEAVKRYYAELSVTLESSRNQIVDIASREGGAAALDEVCKHHQSLVDVGFPSFEVVRLACEDEGAYALSNALTLYNALMGLGFSSDTVITAIHYSYINGDAHALKELVALIEDPSAENVLKDLVVLLERRGLLKNGELAGTSLIWMARNGTARIELVRHDTAWKKGRKFRWYDLRTPNPHDWKNPGMRGRHAPIEAPSNELPQGMTSVLSAPPYNLGESDVASIAQDGGRAALEAVRNNYIGLKDAGFSPGTIVLIARSPGGDEALHAAWNFCQPLRSIGFPMTKIERMASFGDGAHVLQQALVLYSRLDKQGFSHETIIAALGNSNRLTTDELLILSEEGSPRANKKRMKNLIALLERFDDLKEWGLAQTHEQLRHTARWGLARHTLKSLEKQMSAGRSI